MLFHVSITGCVKQPELIQESSVTYYYVCFTFIRSEFEHLQELLTPYLLCLILASDHVCAP